MGGWLSWLERAVHIREVIGSTPIPPTSLTRGEPSPRFFDERAGDCQMNRSSHCSNPIRLPLHGIDDLLFRVRWYLYCCSASRLDRFGGVCFPNRAMVWLVSAVIINLIIGIIFNFPNSPSIVTRLTYPRHRSWRCSAFLPLTSHTRSNLLAYFRFFRRSLPRFDSAYESV